MPALQVFSRRTDFQVRHTIRPQQAGRREAISAALARLVTPSAVMPMLHNHTISIVGEEAHGTCAMKSRVAPNYASGFVGYYHDKLHRFESGWLFTERRWFLYAPVFRGNRIGPDGLPVAPSR